MSINKQVRVRFAPSPTGGLHLGGVRTALFNYLYAKKHGGKFILRIEDTDQTRYVADAENYIQECLAWCGLTPDESPLHGGDFGPYRQSERKLMYRQYAEQLVEKGYAYYAFDTSEELEQQRQASPNFKYSHENRMNLRNSLSLSQEETQKLLADGVPHVIRIKMPSDETISFHDEIRGDVTFDSNLVDDKVLLKADNMPTYHLAVVVDDYLMKISHIFRGEEWLPSAPVHILLWEYLGWKEDIPKWVHLPLILKPDGNGKLSKRDGDRLGFPVFAMNWQDAKSGELTVGYRERGFLPEAFVNLLAMLGWNDGTEQEIFSIQELSEKFDLNRVSKAGAKFDFGKAKWFNQEWIKLKSEDELISLLKEYKKEADFNEELARKVLPLVKERMVVLDDFWEQGSFFFQKPERFDWDSIKGKWNADKIQFFENILTEFENAKEWTSASLESLFKEKIAESQMKVGELMLPLRIMLVGGKFGPHVFDIVEVLGKEEVLSRISHGIQSLS